MQHVSCVFDRLRRESARQETSDSLAGGSKCTVSWALWPSGGEIREPRGVNGVICLRHCRLPGPQRVDRQHRLLLFYRQDNNWQLVGRPELGSRQEQQSFCTALSRPFRDPLMCFVDTLPTGRVGGVWRILTHSPLDVKPFRRNKRNLDGICFAFEIIPLFCKRCHHTLAIHTHTLRGTLHTLRNRSIGYIDRCDKFDKPPGISPQSKSCVYSFR